MTDTTDDKPNIHDLDGAANVAAAIYLEAHFRASQRLMARDLMRNDPDEYTSFGETLEMVEASGSKSLSDEERETTKRKGHFTLMSMGAFGDLSEEDIP